MRIVSEEMGVEEDQEGDGGKWRRIGGKTVSRVGTAERKKGNYYAVFDLE